MKQKYMKYIRWDVDLGDISSAEEQFSAKRMHKIRQSLKALKGTKYTFKNLPLTDELLDEFIVIYNQTMGDKERGLVHKVREMIKTAQNTKNRKYNILGLWEDQKMIGGLVYSRKKHAYSVAYRIFPFKLDVKTPAGASNISEYLLVKEALKNGKTRIIHGLDRNAYGLHADIGLALYKMRLGAVPYVYGAAKNVEHELPEKLKSDVFVCVDGEPGSKCGELVLYTDLNDEEVREKYPILRKYQGIPIRIEKR